MPVFYYFFCLTNFRRSRITSWSAMRNRLADRAPSISVVAAVSARRSRRISHYARPIIRTADSTPRTSFRSRRSRAEPTPPRHRRVQILPPSSGADNRQCDSANRKCRPIVQMGAMNMTDMKMTDRQIAGHEYAGHDKN